MAAAAATQAAFSKLLVTVEAVVHQRFVSYMDVLTSTVLLYEVIVNLPIEIEHIWMRKWSFLTILYLVQRYLPFFDSAGVILYHDLRENLNPHVCNLSYSISGFILTIRVWAVWKRSVPVAIGLTVFFLACWVPGFVFSAEFLGAAKFTTYSNVPGCFIIGGREILYLRWVLLMVYDTGMLVMILIPGVAAYRRGTKSSELVKSVYQDGVVYYAFIFLTSVINVVVNVVSPPDLMFLLSSFERVMHSLLASRAVLHIRQLALQRSQDASQDSNDRPKSHIQILVTTSLDSEREDPVPKQSSRSI